MLFASDLTVVLRCGLKKARIDRQQLTYGPVRATVNLPEVHMVRLQPP
jgi:acid stress-induced BolA-like protein IbaG/YrbA